MKESENGKRPTARFSLNLGEALDRYVDRKSSEAEMSRTRFIVSALIFVAQVESLADEDGFVTLTMEDGVTTVRLPVPSVANRVLRDLSVEQEQS